MEKGRLTNLLTVLSVMLAVVSPLFVAGYASSSPVTKPIELVFATWDPPGSPNVMIMERLQKDLDQIFPGRVNISFNLSSSLGRAPQHYDLAVKGVADITMISTPFTPGRFPVSDLLFLPTRAPSSAIATLAMLDLADKGYLDKEYEAAKLLWVDVSNPVQIVMGKKPVTSLADLKGSKVRASGISAKVVEALGAVPVSMMMPDVYAGLQKGVIDGALQSFESIQIFKLDEVLRYMIQASLGCMPLPTVMNKASWNQLPEDIKKYLELTRASYSLAHTDYHAEKAEKGREALEAAGVQISQLPQAEVDKMGGLLAPVWDDYVKDFEKKGFPVREAADELESFLRSTLGIQHPLYR
jgi:TRAP-type C4-dicarboxylate transport system substrate-binding protein